MHTIFTFASPNFHTKLCRTFAVACVLATGLTAMTPALADQKTRHCNWELKVNNVTRMSGKASGTAGTFRAARGDAKDNVMACYDLARNSSSSVPECSNVFDWDASFQSLVPVDSGTYAYKVSTSGPNNCVDSKKGFSIISK